MFFLYSNQFLFEKFSRIASQSAARLECQTKKNYAKAFFHIACRQSCYHIILKFMCEAVLWFIGPPIAVVTTGYLNVGTYI